MSSRYRRKRNTRNLRKNFVIAVEGERDEIAYFQMLQPRSSSNLILVTAPPNQPYDASPTGTFRRLFHEVNQNPKYNKSTDEFWIVVDVDRYQRQGKLQEAVKECQREGYAFAVSRPSFDLWLVFHIENPIRHLPRDIKKHRKILFNRHHINDFSKLTMTQIRQAWALARTGDDLTQSWPQVAGSHVYKLVEKLIPKLSDSGG